MHALYLLVIAASLSGVIKASTISSVTFSGSPSEPIIVLSGAAFNPQPTQSVLGYQGFIGYDYGTELYLQDTSNNPNSFSAGRDTPADRNFIGLNVLSYGDRMISYKLGSDYSKFYYPNGTYQLNSGDNFIASVHGSSYSGVVSYTTPEPGSLWMIFAGLALLKFTPRPRQDNAYKCE